MTKVKDVLIKSGNPAVLDRTLQSFGAALHQDHNGIYIQVEGCYVARCFKNADFVKFAVTQQGYGEVVRELEELL